MPVEDLGELQRVDPATLWSHEAHDFTPWLLENADGLAEALGIDLELEEAEQAVGAFSLDLVGRDATNDTILIVENQLAATDHGHLGQILTYAAGTGASTIVWIATGFREEHRQALGWLNEQTGQETHFFGIEIEAFKIGDSPPAPHFKIVVQPNEWQKVLRGAAQGQKASGRALLYAAFWDKLLAMIAAEEPGWTHRRPGTTAVTANWIDMPSPVAGGGLNVSFARGRRLRSELYIDSGSQDQNDQVFHALLEQRQVLEDAFGRPLEFEALEGKRAARIAEYSDGDVAEEARHGEFIAWFMDSGRRFRRALAALPPYAGAMTFPAITGPSDPEDFSWEVHLSDEQELRTIDDRHVGVFYEDGVEAVDIEAEAAHDVTGASVPTSLAVTGEAVITLTVHHRAGNPAAGGAPFTYPVIAGVGWEGGFQTEVVQGPPDEQEEREQREERERREQHERGAGEEQAATPQPGEAVKRCHVPKLSGRTLRGARRRLLRADCRVGTVRKVRRLRHRRGRVVGQSVRPGSVLAAGARIRLRVAR